MKSLQKDQERAAAFIALGEIAVVRSIIQMVGGRC